MDNGNNNFLNTAIKANYLPYGIDLPFGKNGSRFTNGKNFADRVGDLVKLPLLPAFSDPRTRGVASFHGVNHASAGSGILDVTGSNMRLYNLGARKFAFLNIGPLGCTPMARASMPNKECNEALNYAAFLFNTQLVQMLDVIRAQMPGFQSVVVNFFQIALEFIRNPSFGGFSDVKNSCCEVSVKNGGGLCKRDGNVCNNRSKYVYFDGLHPTEALYGIVATRAYSSNTTTEVYPFNIQTLAQL
nr:GDSL esterase/lipase At4g18970-like [Spinacia oleracea]